MLLAIASNAIAQSSTSLYVEAGVPTGVSISGDYSGALRPQVHYSPPIDFMVSSHARLELQGNQRCAQIFIKE